MTIVGLGDDTGQIDFRIVVGFCGFGEEYEYRVSQNNNKRYKEKNSASNPSESLALFCKLLTNDA